MANPNADIPPHPKYGKPLSGRPVTVDGVTFRPYRAGILQYVWVSDDYRIEVFLSGSWQRVRLDGDMLSDRKGVRKFRLQSRAMAVAVAIAKSEPAPQTEGA